MTMQLTCILPSLYYTVEGRNCVDPYCDYLLTFTLLLTPEVKMGVKQLSTSLYCTILQGLGSKVMPGEPLTVTKAYQ